MEMERGNLIPIGRHSRFIKGEDYSNEFLWDPDTSRMVLVIKDGRLEWLPPMGDLSETIHSLQFGVNRKDGPRFDKSVLSVYGIPSYLSKES